MQTKIHVHRLDLHIDNVARYLKMEDVYLDVNEFNIETGAKMYCDCNPVSVFELDMKWCRVSIDKVLTSFRSLNSIAKFGFKNTVFDKIGFKSIQNVGYASFVFYNCTFMKAFNVDIERFIDFKILQSSIIVPYNCEQNDCFVHLTGVRAENFEVDSDLLDLFFPRDYAYFNSIIYVGNTTFQGGYGPFITITYADFYISKCFFHIQSHGTPANMIDFRATRKEIAFEDVLINLSSIDTEIQQVNILSIDVGQINFLNTRILCPFRMKAVEKLPPKSTKLRVYYCDAACTSDTYTFQSGNLTLHFPANVKSPVSKPMNPSCNKCPVGAKCNGHIKALPNYWGYRNKGDLIMIRCPNGYCCQDNVTCQKLDSCNSNRTGTLCGVCKNNFTEPILNPAFIPIKKCNGTLLGLLYISCVVAYGLGLLVIGHMKRAFIYSVKKIYHFIKRTFHMKIKSNEKKDESV